MSDIFNLKKDGEEENIDSGICVDCGWDGLLKDADVDYEWDDFYRVDRPYPICPKCGGGIEDYYPSSIMDE